MRCNTKQRNYFSNVVQHSIQRSLMKAQIQNLKNCGSAWESHLCRISLGKQLDPSPPILLLISALRVSAILHSRVYEWIQNRKMNRVMFRASVCYNKGVVPATVRMKIQYMTIFAIQVSLHRHRQQSMTVELNPVFPAHLFNMNSTSFSHMLHRKSKQRKTVPVIN